MIDIERRKKLAFYLRQLATGQISNDDFEAGIFEDVTNGWLPEQYYRSEQSKKDDRLIRPILEYAWCLYTDTCHHKLTGKYALTEQQQNEIARSILFLHSDQAYEWKYVDMTHPILQCSFYDIVKSLVTFGYHYRTMKTKRAQEIEAMKKDLAFEYWPFKTKAALEKQLKYPPFLAGS